MANLPCVSPTETFSWTESATVSRNGSSSVVKDEAEQAAKDLGERMQGEMANSMNEWLKALRCGAGCEIGVIYVGPPSQTLSEHIRVGHGPRYEILGYDFTVTVVGELSVDCHKPVAGKVGHKPGTGLEVLEDMMKKRGIKSDKEKAKQPNGHSAKKQE
jgi:hypothetical protein